MKKWIIISFCLIQFQTSFAQPIAKWRKEIKPYQWVFLNPIGELNFVNYTVDYTYSSYPQAYLALTIANAQNENILSLSFPEKTQTKIVDIIPVENDFLVGFNSAASTGLFEGADSRYQNGWIFRFNRKGEVVWRKYLGLKENNYLQSFVKTPNQDVVVMMNYYNQQKSYLINLDNNGNEVWKRELNDYYGVLCDTDTGISIGGYDKTTLTRFNEIGYPTQSVAYWSGTSGGYFNKSNFVESQDGGLFVSGDVLSSAYRSPPLPSFYRYFEDANFTEYLPYQCCGGPYLGFLYKIDAGAKLLWQKAIQGVSSSNSASGSFGSVAATADGGCVAIGTQYSSPMSQYYRYQLYRINGQGKVVWSKDYGLTRAPWFNDNSITSYLRPIQIIPTPNDEYYLIENDWKAGKLFLSKLCADQLVVPIELLESSRDGNKIKLSTYADSSLTYQWYKNGQPIAGANSAIYQSLDKGVYKVEVKDSYCKQTAFSKEIITNQLDPPNVQFSIYPNPTSDLVQLTIGLEQPFPVKVSVYNYVGQLIQSADSEPRLSHGIKLDLGNYADGVYLIQLEIGGKIITQKVIKNH